jgi:hypothetical protein
VFWLKIESLCGGGFDVVISFRCVSTGLKGDECENKVIVKKIILDLHEDIKTCYLQRQWFQQWMNLD